ncbi:DUF6647 family protein [Ruegeria sp. HKCCD7559]|uniref:DUF6647 family protein n=1 Tax=Ruegeria TaxID=97050 RepID=UPI00148040D0|nr:DUF6647 family protein [Ruegeria sp. HKCCD7559]NOC47349.1 hypothetical protein [Ruegeria sp. HKCCD7559]
MHLCRSLTALFVLQMFLFYVPSPATGQSIEQREFDVPGTGYVIQFKDLLDGQERPSPQLVDALMCWVKCVTELPEPGRASNFRFIQQAAMPNLAFGDQPGLKQNPGRNVLDIEALYDRKNGTIVLPETWRPSPLSLSRFVHELVHHFQAEANLTYACPAAAEALAYDAQERWLGLFGKTLEESFEIDQLTLFVLTNCGF